MNIMPSPGEWSRGKVESVRACPACRSALIAAEYARRDDALAMPDVWRIVHCGACGSMYLADRPDDESLPRAYADYYTHEPEQIEIASDVDGKLARLINGYLNARFRMQRRPASPVGAWLFAAIPPLRMKLDVYGRHVPANLCNRQARLLDVGCGNGAFLCRAREMGLQVHGCEPDIAAAATCANLGLEVTVGDVWAGGYTPASFDYITLNHVIEHVSDAPRLLDKLYELLKPGGILWLALPNPDALGVSLFDRGWKGFHPPFHLLIPSQKILREWLNKAHFVDIHCVRRGMQSPGLWRESIRIGRRERTAPSPLRVMVIRRAGDLLSTLTPRWGEETIMLARHPGMACER